jgi:hypothetical protein
VGNFQQLCRIGCVRGPGMLVRSTCKPFSKPSSAQSSKVEPRFPCAWDRPGGPGENADMRKARSRTKPPRNSEYVPLQGCEGTCGMHFLRRLVAYLCSLRRVLLPTGVHTGPCGRRTRRECMTGTINVERQVPCAMYLFSSEKISVQTGNPSLGLDRM